LSFFIGKHAKLPCCFVKKSLKLSFIQLFSMRIKANSTKAKRIKVEGFYQFCLHGKEIKAGKRIKTAEKSLLKQQQTELAAMQRMIEFGMFFLLSSTSSKGKLIPLE
jgi:nucleoid DNA-binding protein